MKLSSVKRWLSYKLPYAVLIWVGGLVVYCIGFSNAEPDAKCYTVFLRSALSATEMFVGHSNLEEITLEAHATYARSLGVHTWHPDTCYLCCFIALHIAAVVLSLITAFNSAARRFRHFVRLFLSAYFNNKKKELHVFFGVNEASILLAKDILGRAELNPKSAQQRDACEKRNRIVFVQLPRKKNGEKEPVFKKLTGIFPYSRYKHVLDKLKEIGGGVHLAIANKDFCHFKADDSRSYDPLLNFAGDDGTARRQPTGNGFTNPLDLFKRMRLSMLSRIIRERSTLVRLYFLSDDDEANIMALDVLRSDPLFTAKHTASYPHVTIYCQAKRDALNLFEEIRLMENDKVEVQVLNASSLAALYLQREPMCLPVNYVDTEQGRVTTPFHAMVIGFGETGQEMFKYLYENSAFLGTGTWRSAYRIMAVDDHMDDIKGNFLVKHPGLKNNPNLILSNVKVGTEEFWDMVRQEIDTLNYVTVALGDDRTNMSVAVALYKFAIQHRRNMLSRFTIYVRSYNQASESHMNSISQYYYEYNHAARTDETPGNIVVFGELDEIYCTTLVHLKDEPRLEEENDKNAQRILALEYFYTYDKAYNQNRENKKELEPAIHEWFKRRHKAFKDKTNRLINLTELRRKEYQDFANYMHICSKLKLMGLPCAKDTQQYAKLDAKQQKRVYRLYEKAMEMVNDKHEYHEPAAGDKDAMLIDVLAQTEHLRWIASHEINGFTEAYVYGPNSGKNNMKPWSELPAYIKYYDFLVVLTTLELQYEGLDTAYKTYTEQHP